LARDTGTNEYALTLAMRALVAVGLFAQTADGRYVNTSESEALRTDHPESVRYQCILFTGDYQRVFVEILHSLQTGEPATRKVLGGTLYAFLARNPESAEVYDRAMEDLARSACTGFAKSRDFSGIDKIIDIGGGRGGLLKAVLKEHPHLQGVCFDREDVCVRARRGLAAEAPNLVGRLEFAGGSFFEGVPAGASLYLLKNVLHNWNDESCLKILCCVGVALAARSDSRLLVIEPLIESPMHPMYKLFDDLMQVTVCESGVAARTEADFRQLIESAGLAVSRTEVLPSGHGSIEVKAR
jgi:hypothetical protein